MSAHLSAAVRQLDHNSISRDGLWLDQSMQGTGEDSLVDLTPTAEANEPSY